MFVAINFARAVAFVPVSNFAIACSFTLVALPYTADGEVSVLPKDETAGTAAVPVPVPV
jgi:hypothetical protein